MNPRARNLTVAVSTLVVLAVATLLLMQQQTLSGLRTRELVLQTSIESERPAAAGSATPPASSPPPAANTSEPLTDEERTELLQLRGEVTTLNQRLGELASVEQRHDALQAQLDKARVNPKSVEAVVPEGYILRTKARNVGQATPEAALETFLWACEHRDEKALRDTVLWNPPDLFSGPEGQARIQGFWDEVGKLPGFQPVEKTPQPDGSVAIKLAVTPGSGNDPTSQAHMIARPVDGGWKLEFR
ncbi:MAG: hypothetical protein H7A46_01665 [Verrucomicrobiales bacterium]|nr:hypothetical protein [Verrucomicrobiales bacterium]